MRKEITKQVEDIDQSLKNLEVLGISFEADRQWLERITQQVDELRDIRRYEDKVREFDERIETIWCRYECYQEELASLGNNWW